MAEVETPAAATGESKDWRQDCVAPPKDTRVQTAVSINIYLLLNRFDLKWCAFAYSYRMLLQRKVTNLRAIT